MDATKKGIVEFHDISIDEAASRIVDMGATQQFDVVVTPNVDHLSRLTKNQNPELLNIYRDSSLVLCDSKILQKLMRFKGIQVENVIPGSSLTEHMFKTGLLNNQHICIIGSDNDDIARLRFDYPEIRIDHINPSMGFINKPDEVESIIDEVCHTKPAFLFLAVGSPRQEILADKIKARYHQGVGLCIGASILFLVGKEKRAPQIIQTMHLEWLYRAFQRPRVLMKRYFKNFLDLLDLYQEI